MELDKHSQKVVSQGEVIRKLREQIEIRDATLRAATVCIKVLAAERLDENGGDITFPTCKYAEIEDAFLLSSRIDSEKDSIVLRLSPKPPKVENGDIGS